MFPLCRLASSTCENVLIILVKKRRKKSIYYRFSLSWVSAWYGYVPFGSDHSRLCGPRIMSLRHLSNSPFSIKQRSHHSVFKFQSYLNSLTQSLFNPSSVDIPQMVMRIKWVQRSIRKMYFDVLNWKYRSFYVNLVHVSLILGKYIRFRGIVWIRSCFVGEFPHWLGMGMRNFWFFQLNMGMEMRYTYPAIILVLPYPYLV